MNTYRIVWPSKDGRDVTVRRQIDRVDLYAGDTIIAGMDSLISDDAVAAYLKTYLAVSPDTFYNSARRLGVVSRVGYNMDMDDKTATRLQARFGQSIRLEKVEVPQSVFGAPRISLQVRQRVSRNCG